MSAVKAPAFQFYPKDWIADAKVCELSLEEEGAYIRLLSHCWLEGSIPADPERCARIIGKGCSNELATTVQRMFNESATDSSRLVHKRLESERNKQQLRREQASEAGKKSGEKRKNSANPANPESNDRSTDVERKPNPSSSSPSASPTAVDEERTETADAVVANRDPLCPYNMIGHQFIAAFGGTVHLTEKRRKAMRARWKDPFWRENWQAALDKASSLPFFKGSNSRNWKITFDFFLRQDSVVRIIEGNYDGFENSQSERKLTAAEQREQLNARSFQWIRDSAAQADAASGASRGLLSSSTGEALLLEEHGTANAACG